MGKEAGPFAQELGWGEMLFHCSREGGGRLQPLLFLFHPSFYGAHTAESGRWRGEASVNEDLEPWGLQQHLPHSL